MSEQEEITAEQQAENDQLKAELQAREEEKQRKQKLDNYDALLKKVVDLKELTNNSIFKDLWRKCKRDIENAKNSLLLADKPRDIAHDQEAVKVINSILEFFGEPVKDLNEFMQSTPLFAKDFHTRAQWHPESGDVELRTK